MEDEILQDTNVYGGDWGEERPKGLERGSQERYHNSSDGSLRKETFVNHLFAEE